MWSRTMVD